jgi:hypothetical protein
VPVRAGHGGGDPGPHPPGVPGHERDQGRDPLGDGGKTCGPLLRRLFREEGVPVDEVTDYVPRLLFVEVPLGLFAGAEETRDA